MPANRNDRAIGCLLIFVGVIVLLAAAAVPKDASAQPFMFPLLLAIGVVNILLGIGVIRSVPWALLTVAILYAIEVLTFPLRVDWSNPGPYLAGGLVGVVMGLVFGIYCFMRFLELVRQGRPPS